MKTALVTGANKGIGFEVAGLLAMQGYYVFLGSRDLQAGATAVGKLKATGLQNIEAIQLDVSDQQSVDAVRKDIGEKTGTLDVLINNAGISGGFEQTALGASASTFQEVFETNVFGVARVTQAFADLLTAAPGARIVNVSTSMASLNLAADIHNEHYPRRYAVYQSSKAAVNMYTINLAYELRKTAVKVNAVCPGWTRTDFTGGQGSSTAIEAAQRIVKYALIGDDGPTGAFFSEEYFPAPAVCPW